MVVMKIKEENQEVSRDRLRARDIVDVSGVEVSFEQRTIRTSQRRFELSFELLRRSVPFEFMATEVTSPK